MRVLFDATAVPADRGGVGRYVDELLPRLAEADGVKLIVVAQGRDEEFYSHMLPGTTVLSLPPLCERRAARMAWEQTVFPTLIHRLRPDVVQSPHYTMPRFSSAPVVVTLHDATFFSNPEWHLRSKAMFFRRKISLAVKNAAALVVPSHATQDEVLRFTGGDASKFFVAYHGVDHEHFHPVDQDEQRRVRTELGLGTQPYIGFLGTLEPRKNVPALIHGWVEAFKDATDPPALVLAGGAGWDAGIEQACADVPAGLSLVRPGYVQLADLAGFLSGADIVAYPSLGEGFGLPVLEAMACGATVLTTRRLSLPEVGGDAVAYTETGRADIAEALKSLMADSKKRTKLATEAIARATQFTWEAAAQAHVRAYSAALG